MKIQVEEGGWTGWVKMGLLNSISTCFDITTVGKVFRCGARIQSSITFDGFNAFLLELERKRLVYREGDKCFFYKLSIKVSTNEMVETS